jgi:hypothetical protein
MPGGRCGTEPVRVLLSQSLQRGDWMGAGVPMSATQPHALVGVWGMQFCQDELVTCLRSCGGKCIPSSWVTQRSDVNLMQSEWRWLADEGSMRGSVARQCRGGRSCSVNMTRNGSGVKFANNFAQWGGSS